MIESSKSKYSDDEFHMHQALSLALQAYGAGEVPIGALVVNAQGDTIGTGYNQVEREQSQIAHAEMIALQKAGRSQGGWRLTGCTLYITLEPCVMCLAAASLSRVERVVYGADSPLFGYRLDKEGTLELYMKHIKGITSGVLADESAKLLREFFSKKRIRDNERK